MIRKLQLGFLCLLVAGCTSSGSDAYSASAQDELGQVTAALTYEIPVGQIRKSVFQSERVKFERLLCFERPGGLVLSGATALARMDAAKYRAGLDVMLDSARANLAEGGVAVSVLTPDGAETGQILIPWNPSQRTALSSNGMFLDLSVPFAEESCYLKTYDVGRTQNHEDCTCEQGYAICCGNGPCPGGSCGACLVARPEYETLCPSTSPFLDAYPFDRFVPGDRF